MAEENQDKNEALEKGKQAVKNKIMQKAKPWIIKGVVVLLGIILAGALVLGIFDAIGDAIQSVTEAITDFFTLDEDGAIVISEEQIDAVINSITDLGVDLEDLYLMGDVDYDDPDIEAANKKALRLYIKKFYEAQAMTQTINTNPNWLEQLQGKTYGTIYVYRTNGEDIIDKDTKATQLSYMPYDKLKQKKESGNANVEDLSKYFSLDEEGRLVVVGWSTTNVTQNGQRVSSQTNVSLRTIDYKNVVSQYTTSMDFLLYLALVAQNPEFVSAVTDLIKNSEIRITLLDTTSETVDTQTEQYTINTENIANRTISSRQVTSVKQTTTKSRNPTAKITYARTWFSEQTITYNKKEKNYGGNNVYNASNDTSLADQTPPAQSTNGVRSWITGRTKTINSSSKSTSYEEGTRGDVIDRTGEKGSQGIKDTNNNGKVDGTERVDKESTFIGLLDNKFKIPNTTRYVAAGRNIAESAELLFRLLQKDATSQNLEQLMRYILYKYTGRNYGVTEFNFNMYDIQDFKTVGGGGSELLREYIHSWEHSTPPPTNADGTKYIVESDIYGDKAVGYGVDIPSHANLFIEAGYSIEPGSEIDKDFVDAIEKEAIDSKVAVAKALSIGSDLTGYQIHALVSRMYNCGEGVLDWQLGSPALNFIDSYNAYWKEEDDFFEEKNQNANFLHPLYTQHMSLPVTGGGNYYEGLARRRKSEWRLFQTGYYDTLDKWYSGMGTGGVTTDEEAADLQNYIETELIHTQVHRGGSYQNGPFAKWWTAGYNNLQPFQCTWWANGRASMYLEQNGSKYTKYPTQYGDGGDYYSVNKQNGWFNYGSEPKPNSIISWTQGGAWGHVAYVEGVTSDGIYISEAGNGTDWYGVRKIPLDGSYGGSFTLNGYVYLDEPL